MQQRPVPWRQLGHLNPSSPAPIFNPVPDDCRSRFRPAYSGITGIKEISDVDSGNYHTILIYIPWHDKITIQLIPSSFLTWGSDI